MQYFYLHYSHLSFLTLQVLQTSPIHTIHPKNDQIWWPLAQSSSCKFLDVKNKVQKYLAPRYDFTISPSSTPTDRMANDQMTSQCWVITCHAFLLIFTFLAPAIPAKAVGFVCVHYVFYGVFFLCVKGSGLHPGRQGVVSFRLPIPSPPAPSSWNWGNYTRPSVRTTPPWSEEQLLPS